MQVPWSSVRARKGKFVVGRIIITIPLLTADCTTPVPNTLHSDHPKEKKTKNTQQNKTKNTLAFANVSGEW